MASRFRIIGLSDGLTVPFALTAGLSSLGESKLVVLGGVAELIAGAISMGVGGFCAYLIVTAPHCERARGDGNVKHFYRAPKRLHMSRLGALFLTSCV